MRTALAALTALGLLASPGLASGPRAVSGPSPHGECTVPNGQRGAEGSPVIARPGDPVVLWQQDLEHDDGGEVITQAAGQTSTAGPLEGGQCGPRGRTGDLVSSPSAVTAPDGTVWSVNVVNGAEVAQVRLAHLPPGGTWSSEVVAEQVAPLPNLGFLPATVAVAPTDPPTVHVAYVRNQFPTGTVAVHRSREVGSKQWSPEHVISAGATPLGYDFAEQVVSLGGQHLLAVSTEVDLAGFVRLLPDYAEHGDLTQAPVEHRVRHSRDGGRSWTDPVLALRLENGSVRDPEDGETALRSLVRPSVAVAPSGRVHIAGESVSSDGGRTSVLVATPCGAAWCSQVAAVVPGLALAASVAVDGTGDLAVSWLDLSDDVVGDDGLTARWRWSSTGPQGWSKPRPLTEAFDLRLLAPSYVGDQGALLGRDRGFLAAPVVGTGDKANPSDVLLLRLSGRS